MIRRKGRSDAMSKRGICRRPDPPSSEAGRGRLGVAYTGVGRGFSGVGSGVTLTSRGTVSFLGAEVRLGGLRLFGGCSSFASSVRLRSFSRARRNVITDSWFRLRAHCSEGGEADLSSASIWYPAFRAGKTIRGLVSAMLRRKARRIRCLIGLPGPQACTRLSGSWMAGACLRRAR